MATVKTIPGCKPMEIGEGPHWIEKDQALLYVNIPKGHIFRFFTETGRLQQIKIANIGLGVFTSLVVPVDGVEDEFIISIGKSLAWIKWPKSDPDYCTKNPISICQVDTNRSNRFNDGKCDPTGRLWAGTMAYETSPAVLQPHEGTLYKIDSNLSASRSVSKLTIPNGIAWSLDQKNMYFIDSLDYSVDVFDYDNSSGTIANRRVLFDYKKAGLNDELPDGMCIDANGNLWIACYRGAKVICVDPASGTTLQKLKIPSSNVTSCCWGGKDYSTLYVTSAHLGLPTEEFENRPETGKTFSVTGLGVKGLPPVDFKIDLEPLGLTRNQL